MSKILSLAFALLFGAVQLLGQPIEALNGYKYVFVPTLKYDNGKIDAWGICAKLRSDFANKGFIVFDENTPPPEEYQENPCLLLNCTINHSNNMTYGTNEVHLTLKNCKGQIVYTSTGKGMGTTMQDDFDKATRKAFRKLDDLKYRFDPRLAPQFEYPKVETTNESEQTLKNYLDSTKLNIVEGIYKSYQNDKMGYYKFAVKRKDDKYVAIIIEASNKAWKPGEVKAVFEPSSMVGLYSVKWYMGDKTAVETFGEMENDALLSIEFTGQNGEKTSSKFVKMYPTSGNPSATLKPASATSSGFFVSTDGLIATNAHVVEGAKNIDVDVSNEIGSFSYKAKLVLIDSKNDVALIRVDDDKFKGLTSLPYGISEKADIGEKSFTIGYPLNDIMGSNYKVTDGIISAKSGIADDVRYFQISVPLQPGNSGGPLFNSQGNVIGITSARLNGKAVGTSVENVNYAIKATYLISLMNMLPNSAVPKPSNQLSTKQLTEQVRVLKNYVCLIHVNQ